MEEVFRAKLNSEGRLNIPATCRNRLGWQPGQEIFMQIGSHGLLVYTQEQTLKRIQEWMAAAVPPGVSVADGLIAQRRTEEVKEAGE